jgi:hypothetical protein
MAGLGWQELVLLLLMFAVIVCFVSFAVLLIGRREPRRRDREAPD